jgi:hypothetical protein
MGSPRVNNSVTNISRLGTFNLVVWYLSWQCVNPRNVARHNWLSKVIEWWTLDSGHSRQTWVYWSAVIAQPAMCDFTGNGRFCTVRLVQQQKQLEFSEARSRAAL